MPEIVTCPNCTRKLRVPEDLVGKTVKCPECKQAFLAQTESVNKGEDKPDEPPTRKSDGHEVGVSTGPRGSQRERAPTPSFRRDEEEDEDHPSRPVDDLDDDDYADRPRGKTSVRAGWGRVRLGLNLMIWGIYAFLAAFVVLLLCAGLAILLAVVSGAGAFKALTSTSPGASNTAAGGAGAALIAAVVVAIVGYGIFLLAVLAKTVLDGIGHVFYLWIPDRPGTGRRPLAIAALSLWSAALVLPFVGYALQCAGMMSRTGSLMAIFGLAANCSNLISLACTLAWFFVFMSFLRTVAVGTGNSGLARNIVIYMITVPVWCVVSVLSFVGFVCLGAGASIGLASKSSSPGGAAGIGTLFLIVVLGLEILILIITVALWIWYVVILHRARNSISERLSS